MYAVSTRWANAVKHSHTALARVDVDRGGDLTTFKIESGTVVQDYDDATRWGLDVEVVDEEGRSWTDMRDLVNPFFSKITPWAGIRYADGEEEWVPCGEVFVSDLDVVEEDSGAVRWRLNTFDASSRLKSKMPVPYVIAGDTDPTAVVAPLLHPRFPSLTIVRTPTPYRVGPLIIREGSSPWEEAQRLVTSTGLELAVNRLGLGTMQARVTDASIVDPVWSFDELDRPDFAEVERRQTLQDRPNVIVVIGTHPNAPGVVGIAFDNDPRSDTYRYGGEYGEVVEEENSEQVFSNPQANAMASALLSARLGPQDQVTFKAIRNPALDVGDVVIVNRARMGLVNVRMIVTHIECPMHVDDWMIVTCRRSLIIGTETTRAV
jgi:hypothetical protein